MLSVTIGAVANLILDPLFAWIEFRHKRSGDRNNHFPDFIGKVYVFYFEKESGIESAGAVKRRMESM